MKVMPVSLSPAPPPQAGEGRFEKSLRDFEVKGLRGTALVRPRAFGVHRCGARARNAGGLHARRARKAWHACC
jgi:hypothetical protein